MSKKIKKIQKTIEDILGTDSSLLKKQPTLKDQKRKLFSTTLNNLAYLNARTIGLKHDFKIDFAEYDETFFQIIESLMKLSFTKEQRSIINWWLYDKFLPDGNILILNSEDTGEEIPTETPDDIWELIQKWNEKEDSK